MKSQVMYYLKQFARVFTNFWGTFSSVNYYELDSLRFPEKIKGIQSNESGNVETRGSVLPHLDHSLESFDGSDVQVK